ncbi:MAG: ADOP family duplicated permease [Bryobacteraceae bacterium]|jgi:predicted permease
MSAAEWIRDLRLALRLLAKNPGATALAVLSIALGIGLTTGLFAVGDAVFLRPLPVEKPQELWSVTSRGDDGNFMMYGWLDYLDMAKALEGRAQFVATQRRGVQVGDSEDSQFVIIQPASPNFFQVLGVKAALGRASLGEAEGRPETVLGYRLWQTQFSSDPHIVGKTVLLNHKAFLVAGVMPEAFAGLERGVLIGVWVSTDAWFSTLGNREEEQSREGQFDLAARFRAPLSAARAQAQLDAAIRGPGKHKPAPRGAAGTTLECFVKPWLKDLILGGGMIAVFGLVLFVACANVAQLRLAQGEARRKELGVRIALGGGGWRVARQLLLETGLLGLAGAGLGLLLAQLLAEKVTAFARAISPFIEFGIRLDYRVLAYSAGALLLAVLVSGVWPALHAVRLNIADVLKQSQGVTTRRRGWHQKTLVISQIAVSVALFGVAVLFLTSLHHATEIRPGLDPHKKVLALMVAPALHIPPAAWCDQVSERLAALPGARGATYARRLPLSGSGGGMTARVEVPGMAPMGVHLNNVGANYFSMMGTRVVAGRGIDSQDREGAPLAVVVSQTFAHTVFGDRNALGEWVRIDGQLRQVVGVAEDGPSNDLHEQLEPFLYLPYAQSAEGDITLLVETAGEPAALDRAARAAIHGFDPGARVYDSTTLQKTLDSALSPDRFVATACSGLGLSALLLTAAGLFGVLLYAVNRRTREFGLRVALGARPRQIERLVMGESLRLAVIGVPIGLAGLAASARLAGSMLLGVTPLDPLSYVLSAAAAVGLALVAAWLPARRATRVDPMEALRAE